MNALHKTANPAPMQLAQLQALLQQLPDSLQAAAQAQLSQRVQQVDHLRVSLVGAFSVGKSSLLNMLLGEEWLHTAQEEATALPTVIEYASTPTLYLVQQDGQQQPLDRDGFTQVTTHAPEGAKYAALQLPQPWLQQLSIIDLPGLGSTSAQHYQYTLMQVQQSDAIVYLIAPRGPSASDLQMLTLIRQYGKAVCLVVGRWDEVEQAVARGEKIPNLIEWQQQIAQATGIDQPLITAHRTGLGREPIQQFLQQCQQQLSQIRLQRFVAEIQPELQNALQLNQQAQQTCEAQTEAQIQQRHEQLLQMKGELIEAKAQAYSNQQTEQQQLEQQATQQVQQQRDVLQAELQLFAAGDWTTFLQQGEQALASGLASLAQQLQQHSAQYGALQLPEQTIRQLNLRLPEPELVDSNDFLEHAQLEQLKQRLTQKITEAQQMSASDVDVAQLNQYIGRTEEVLQQLVQDRHAILSTPIPEIERVLEDRGGEEMGRRIGNVLDALMIVIPAKTITTVVGKVGSLAKAALTTQKAVTTAKTVASTTQAVATTTQAVANTAKAASTASSVIGPVANVLSMLSLAEWGAKIGSLFDSSPEVVYQQDPALKAQVYQQAQQVHQQIQQLRDDIAQKEQLMSQQQMTGFALQQSQREIQQLQQHAEQLQRELQQRQQQAAEAQQQQQRDTLERYRVRAIEQWLSQFDTQSRSMLHLLQQLAKQYWQHSIDQLFAARIAETEQLQGQLSALPEQKQTQLVQLQRDARAIEQVLQQLV